MRTWERWASLTGVGFVLSSAIAFLIVPDPPSADDGSEFVLNFFSLNDSDVLWQCFFFGLGGIFLLWFGGTPAGALPRAQGDALLPAAAFVWAASLGIARSALLPQSVGWVGGVVGLLLVVNAGGRLLGDSADFAAGGTVNTITFVLFLFWVLVTSIFLAQRVPVARRAPEGQVGIT